MRIQFWRATNFAILPAAFIYDAAPFSPGKYNFFTRRHSLLHIQTDRRKGNGCSIIMQTLTYEMSEQETRFGCLYAFDLSCCGRNIYYTLPIAMFPCVVLGPHPHASHEMGALFLSHLHYPPSPGIIIENIRRNQICVPLYDFVVVVAVVVPLSTPLEGGSM